MKIASIFPGQGTQFKGMGRELKSDEIFVRASNVVGYDVKELCLNDPEGRLGHTQYTQVAIVTVSYGMYLESGISPDIVAGHSVGEYAAICAAGCVPFEDSIRIVQKRGELMAAADGGQGSMAAVIGLGLSDIKSLCKKNHLPLDIAVINDEDQIVVSGNRLSIDAFGRVIEDMGKKYIKYIPLLVGCAAHSRFMESARRELAAFIKVMRFADPSIPIVVNATAGICRSGEQMKEHLLSQLVNTVQWEKSVRTMLQYGVEQFVEHGPKSVLSKFVQRIRSKIKS